MLPLPLLLLLLQAFAGAGVDVNTYPVNELLNVVAYHFCAFTRSYRLLVSADYQLQLLLLCLDRMEAQYVYTGAPDSDV
jgi:hypothetical protein